MSYQTVTTVEQLRELYDHPTEGALKKERMELDQFSRKFIELSPFSVVSTSDKQGRQDSSPRGDYPGFIKILDDHTLVIPDRRGNNRLDTLENLLHNPQIGISTYVPGFDEVLRINGSAELVTNKELIEQFEYKNTFPKLVIVVHVETAYFHCAKALTRSKLWSPESIVDRSLLPSLGRILLLQRNPNEIESELKRVEDYVIERTKNALY